MALYDLGLVTDEEPFKNLLTQGMVNKDGKKMSKSLGNVVSPAEILEKYGADTARLFILFAAPPEKELDWSDAGVEGSFRFLNRVYRLVYETVQKYGFKTTDFEIRNDNDKQLNYMANYAVKKVSDDAGGRFQFNTAISTIMEFVNELYRYKELPDVNEGLINACIEKLVLILSPFTPHVCEEMWEYLGHTGSLYNVGWPAYDESALVKDSVEIVIQINGKVKEKMSVASGLGRDELQKTVMESEAAVRAVDGRNIVKVIAVPDKLVNIVVK